LIGLNDVGVFVDTTLTSEYVGSIGLFLNGCKRVVSEFVKARCGVKTYFNVTARLGGINFGFETQTGFAIMHKVTPELRLLPRFRPKAAIFNSVTQQNACGD
jgi:hypothetical protein